MHLLPSLAFASLEEQLQQLGSQSVRMGPDSAKEAGDAQTTHSLAGRLYLSASGWLLLSVPNAIGRGAFAALDEAGAELPLKDGVYTAHISVMRPDEIEQLGGPDKISERGKAFHYTLGPVRTVAPTTWDGVSRVWYITVNSPELRELRRSYGLSAQPNEDWDFHVTFAVRKTGVLSQNETRKAASVLDPFEPSSASACKTAEEEERGPKGEYCPYCDARLEYNSEDEKCNRCGREYPPSKLASLALTKTAENLLVTLRKIKAFSDAKKYKAKERMLRRLMLQNPQDWLVDQPARYHPGVTHVPTGFKYHTTMRGIPQEVPIKAGESPIQTLPRAMKTPLQQGPARNAAGKQLPMWQQAVAMPARIGITIMNHCCGIKPKPAPAPVQQPRQMASPMQPPAPPVLKRAEHQPTTLAETALWTTPLRIDTSRGVLGNLGDHLSRLRDNFRSQLANRRVQSDLAVAANPELGWERLHQIARGGDPFVDTALDRTLANLVG